MKIFRLQFLSCFEFIILLWFIITSFGSGARLDKLPSKYDDPNTPIKLEREIRSARSPSSVYGDDNEDDTRYYESFNKNNTSNVLSALLPNNYNKLEIPTNGTWMGIDLFQVYIEVSIFFRKILDINEKDEELLLDADLGLQWLDHRIYDHLKQNGFKDPITGEKKRNLTLDSLVLKYIWKPDIFIDEMASVEKTAILSKLTTLDILGDADTDSGTIVYSARNTLRLRCDMDFHYYPADTQTCVYHLRSYTYDETNLRLVWALGRGHGIFLNDLSDSNFDLQIMSTEPYEKVKEFYILEKFNKFRDGKYSALQFTIKIRRKLSYHIVQTYFPSTLLIFITWLCFLLPSTMVEARIGISMTTVLTLTAMFAAVRGQSPSVSYTMAIDIWMVFCIFFVFVALLLFTFIYWMKMKLSRHHQRIENTKNSDKLDNEVGDSKGSELDISEIEKRKIYYDKTVFLTKRYAFFIFSVIFVAFIISYWSWLLVSSNYFDWDPHPWYNAVDEEDLQGRDDDYDYKPSLYVRDTVLFPNNTNYQPGEIYRIYKKKQELKELEEANKMQLEATTTIQLNEEYNDSVTEGIAGMI